MKGIPTLICVAAIASALAACASVPSEPAVKIVRVEVPVPVPCQLRIEEPAFPDTDEALAAVKDVFEGVKLLMAGRALRIAHDGEMHAGFKGCAGAQ
jgi:hypothetical protein